MAEHHKKTFSIARARTQANHLEFLISELRNRAAETVSGEQGRQCLRIAQLLTDCLPFITVALRYARFPGREVRS